MKLKKNKSLTAFANENKIVYKHIKDSAILLKRMCTEVDCKECPFSFYGSCKFYDKETNLKELIKLIDERKEDVYHPSKMEDIAKKTVSAFNDLYRECKQIQKKQGRRDLP